MVNPAGGVASGRVEKCAGAASTTVEVVEGTVPQADFQGFKCADVSGTLSIPNPRMGEIPASVRWYFYSKSNEHGYKAGDYVALDLLAGFSGYMTTGFSADEFWLSHADDCNLNSKTGGGATEFVPLPANWELRYRAIY